MAKQKFDSDIVIGLEIHVEGALNTKLFCSCPTTGSEEPNTRTCVTCLGMPGSKPVINKMAIEFALRLCLALECEISPELIFSRKSYFYPDMAKNYQISQFEIPIGLKGKLRIENGKEVGITRVHMEEDPAALVHPGTMQSSPYVFVDYNRSGNLLLEVVSEPDLTSPEEARDFMKKLITVLNYIGIFDINRCIIKADANVSVKESGYIRAEVKNVTGFKEIERALNYEVERQKQDIANGKKLIQETRAWDSNKGVTFSLRSKETEADYGYIIDPDLVRVELSNEMVNDVKENMPELAESKVNKFVTKHKISREDAKILSQEKLLAELFEKVAEEVDPKLAARWLRRELLRVLNYSKKSLEDVKIDEKIMIELLLMVEKKEITETVAQKIIEKLIEEPFSPREYVEKEGLKTMQDSGEIEKICKEVVKENKQAVDEFKAGNQKSFNFLVGQVMRKTQGKASPKEVNEMLKKLVK